MRKSFLAIFIFITLGSSSLFPSEDSFNELSKLNHSEMNKLNQSEISIYLSSFSLIFGSNLEADTMTTSIVFERFINYKSPFSWSIAATAWSGEDDYPSYMLNSSIYYHPFKNLFFDPYVGIGVTIGYSEGDDSQGDFPFTAGINLWISKNFGIKTQLRYYPLKGNDFTTICAGFSFSI